MSFAIFRLETFVCDPSLGYFRLEFGNFRVRSFALKHSLGDSNCESFVWKYSPGIFRFIYYGCDVSFGSVCLGSFAWEFSIGHFRLGTSISDRPL